jgi:hypothetical protein
MGERIDGDLVQFLKISETNVTRFQLVGADGRDSIIRDMLADDEDEDSDSESASEMDHCAGVSEIVGCLIFPCSVSLIVYAPLSVSYSVRISSLQNDPELSELIQQDKVY